MSRRQEKFRVVSVNDPAIDTERMTVAEMRAYYESRDEKLIAPFIKAGQQPLWYHVREIPRRLMKQVDAVDVASFRAERAFLAGVTAIEGLPQPDGASLSVLALSRDGNDMIREETLDEHGIAWGAVSEIGLLCWDHSFLAQRTARTYRLPLTSLEALSARAFRSAASSPSSPAPNSESTSQAASDNPPEPATHNSASASDAPTAATATQTPSQAGA